MNALLEGLLIPVLCASPIWLTLLFVLGPEWWHRCKVCYWKRRSAKAMEMIHARIRSYYVVDYALCQRLCKPWEELQARAIQRLKELDPPDPVRNDPFAGNHDLF